MENKEPKIVFDIINSVKGGSGKSTVALQLAAFWASKEATDAYIIDLDLRGTSWNTNYEKYFLNKGEYINSLMYDFCPLESVFWHFNVVCENTMPPASQEPVMIHLCMCDPNISGDVDAVKVDLLESAVYRIISYALSQCGRKKEVHFIFDMPPSYESHAERVVKHLLMDKESSLFLDYSKDKDAPYYINLLMVYAITGAHVEQDLVYTRDFFEQVAYSSEITKFIKYDKFSLYFLGNDVSDVLSTNPASKSEVLNKIKGLFQNPQRLVIPSMNGKLKNKLVDNLQVIEHMPLGSRNLQYFLGAEQAELKLMSEALGVFKMLFNPKTHKVSDGEDGNA